MKEKRLTRTSTAVHCLMMTSFDKSKAIANVLCLADEEQLAVLLDDLLTDSEIEKVHERIKIIECLGQKLSQRETAKKTQAAIATVTRGAQLMKKPSFLLGSLIEKGLSKSWWRRAFWNN